MTTRRTRRRRWEWKWLVLVLLGLGGIYFSRGWFQRIPKHYPATAFHQVRRADLLISVAEEGALRALNETVVRSGLEGYNRIIQLVPEGSYVQKGDLLVELDSSGLRDRLNEQELLHQERLFQMEQARGNLNIQKSLAESQVKEAELRAENAQADFEKYRDADAPFLIRTVEARSSVLAEQVRIAGERLARTGELVKQGNATKSESEADALSLRREQVALSQYQEDLRLIKKFDQPNQVRLLKSKVEQAQAELLRLRARTSNEVAQAEADLKTSQGALEFLEESIQVLGKRLASTKILAPQNGLVVYAQVSPFQMAGGDDRRREEGRIRGGRPGEGGGGEARGGGRRGGRSNPDSGARSGGSGSTTAETVASGNQRTASAQSGSSVTDPGGGGGNGGGGAGSGGGGGSGGAGGQNASSAAGAFATYPSMRPSSLRGANTATNASGNGGASGGGSMLSTGNQNSSLNLGNTPNARSGGQNFRDFGGFESFGTPGMLEAGMMVRQRQELIRLPDVSKMLAEVAIDEARVAQIRSGLTAYIQVRNIPERRFQGTVRRVALLPDAQASWMNPDRKVFPTDILVEEELPILKPGVSVRAEIIITNLARVLSVPIQTVTRWNGENVCFIRKGSRVVPVPVTTGWFNDAFVEIKAGLAEGDLVLLAPASDEESEEEDEGDTHTGKAAEPPPRPPQAGEPPADGRQFQRATPEPSNDEPLPDRRRGRPGGPRRSPNSQGGPE